MSSETKGDKMMCRHKLKFIGVLLQVFLVLLFMSGIQILSEGGVLAASLSRVTPQDFGGKGDGKADDTKAIQDALTNSGGLVCLPAGTYRITQSIRLTSNTVLTGCGTILVDFDLGLPSSENTALYGVGVQNVSIEGITIWKTFVDGSYGTGILIAGGSNVRIKSVDICGYSARYGIHILESENFEISSCYIHDFLVNTTTDMIQDSPAGIRITRSYFGVIANNRVIGIEVGPKGLESISPLVPKYGKQGYQSDCMTIVQSKYITITGNVVALSGEGLDLLVSESLTVTGNIIKNIWFQGIKMMGTQYSTVSNNQIEDCYQGIGLAYNPVMDKEAVGNTVTGNVIRNTGSTGTFEIPAKDRVRYVGVIGLLVNDNSEFNTITGNVIIDTQEKITMEWGIYKPGKKDNIIEGNVVSGALKGSNIVSSGDSGLKGTVESLRNLFAK
jgi:parallel beta-helix repeat protein